jgi:hypothetical protein
MANVSRPRGFVPVRHTNGSAWNGQTQDFLLDSGDATAVYVGDPVKIAGAAGVAAQIVAGQDVEGMATIARCASGAAEQLLVGVVVGFSVDPTNLMTAYRVASTSRIAHVVVDPTVVYEVQEDGVTSNLAAADVGLNISFSTTAGSTTTGVSGIQLISNAKATTVTLPCKILGLAKRPDNAFGLASSDKAKIEVTFNTGAWAPNVVGG